MIKVKFKDLDIFVKVSEADKLKILSWRYLHTYNMYNVYCSHINTSDPYEET